MTERLRDRGHETRCVRNITDVDDDILDKARQFGVHYLDLAAAETVVFRLGHEIAGVVAVLERTPSDFGHRQIDQAVADGQGVSESALLLGLNLFAAV